MGGHVFVVPGRLESLRCDDVLVSTDARGDVGESWWPVFGWSPDEGPQKRRSFGSFPEGTRVLLAQDGDRDAGEPRRWLADVGGYAGRPVDWLLDGVREALTTAAERDVAPLGPRRRIALPIMGVAGGGYDQQRGAVIHGLLAETQRVAEKHDVDVVLVANNLADYSACQGLRRQPEHDRPLDEGLERKAVELAGLAQAGALAVFMGAGIGIAAGLPSWGDLLTALAERLGVDPDGLDQLGPLDAAEYLRRATGGGSAAETARALGCLVGEVIGHPTRYALSHAFLAALDVEQALTTNFDQLYEIAAQAIREEEPLVVLPDNHPAQVAGRGSRRPWLLKLHGDIDRPERIVLDRRSFVTYDARRRPLGGVLQAALLTKHLLVVGASMTDDNVIRLVHEVAELTEDLREPAPFGTVLSVRTDPLRLHLWEPEFDFVDLGADTEDDAVAARELEIFLDRVALLAAPRSAHLLDPRYRELLRTPEERELADELRDVVARVEAVRGSDTSSGWDDVAAALGGFGAHLE